LLLLLFFSLLREELAVTGFVYSRMRAHLPPIADVLNRWSEKKGTMSLWTALGFPKASCLPSNIRLLCKFLALFIISRLQKEDATSIKAINEKFDSLVNDTDFSNWSVLLTSTLKPQFLDKQVGLEQLPKLLVDLSQQLLPEEMERIPSLYRM
jgi:hypothetical protein